MFKGLLLIILVIHIGNSSCSAIDALYDTGSQLWKLYSSIDKLAFNETYDVGGLPNDNMVTNQGIKKQMDVIHEQLNQIEEFMNSKMIADAFKASPFNIMIFKCMDRLQIFVASIDEYYSNFCESLNVSNYDYNNRWPNLQKSIILNVEENIQMIRKIVHDTGDYLPNEENLVTAIAAHASSLQIYLCDGPYIISEVLVYLFRMVIIAEIKVNVILASANLNRNRRQLGRMYSDARDEFQKQFGNYYKQFSLDIESTERLYMRACDPANGIWTRDESFYELEGTFQTTIFQYHWTVCKFENCNKVWLNGRQKCEAKYYDIRSSCSGILTECAYLNAIQACVLKTGPHKFQYVNSTALGSLGKNFTCPKNNGYMIEDGKGWNNFFAACACNCYGNHNKISLKIMESTVRSNMVITGLRFLRKDGILYLQPREGKLVANGYILRYSERWVRIQNNVPASQMQTINKEHRTFFLDDLRLPSGFVLTGVKFNKVTRENLAGFAIEIFGSPFDYRTGRLNKDNALRTSKKEADENLGEGLSFEGISSVYTASFHTPSLGSKYVSLRRSELRDDFGQSTLPLFDAVPINLHPPSALGGIGIFHKGAEGYAGLISLRVYGISYAKYFHDFEFSHMKNGRVKFECF